MYKLPRGARIDDATITGYRKIFVDNTYVPVSIFLGVHVIEDVCVSDSEADDLINDLDIITSKVFTNLEKIQKVKVIKMTGLEY